MCVYVYLCACMYVDVYDLYAYRCGGQATSLIVLSTAFEKTLPEAG